MLVCELLREDAVARKDRHQDEERIELEVYHIGGTISDMEGKQDTSDPEDEDLEDDGHLETRSARSEETDAPEYSNFEVVSAEFHDVVDIVDRLYRLAAKLRSTTARNPPSARNFYRDPYLDSDGNDLALDRKDRTELRKRAKEQTERFHYRRIKEIVRQALRDEAGKSSPEETERVKLGPQDKNLARSEARNRHIETKIKLSPHTKSVVRRIATGTAYRQQQFIFWRQREWERKNAVTQQDMRETKEVSRRQASKTLADARDVKEIRSQGLGIPADRKVAFSRSAVSNVEDAKRGRICYHLTRLGRSRRKRNRRSRLQFMNQAGERSDGRPFQRNLMGRKSLSARIVS